MHIMRYRLQVVLLTLLFVAAPTEAGPLQADTLVLRSALDRPVASYGYRLVHDGTGVHSAVRPARRNDGRKSSGGALLRALGSTAISVGLGTYLWRRDNAYARGFGRVAVVVGGVVGPSAGHFYVRNRGQAWNGIAVRGSASAVGALAVWRLRHTTGQVACPNTTACDAPEREIEQVLTGVLLGVAVTTVLFRTVYDLATTWRAARRYNEAQGFSVRPTFDVVDRRVGMTARWAF